MSCITKILELKGDKKILPIRNRVVVEDGGQRRHRTKSYVIQVCHNMIDQLIEYQP